MGNRVFISGRVSGLREDTVRKNFSKAEKSWKNLGYDVVNPTKMCKKEWSWLRCMAVCLWNLAKCDAVYFMSNYKNSKGAQIELKVAKMLRKKLYF